jgi:hypothetical protein
MVVYLGVILGGLIVAAVVFVGFKGAFGGHGGKGRGGGK